MQPVIFGMAGESLNDDERDFFRDAHPVGYILFKRNCVNREQLRRLTDTLRALHGRDDVPILIDQEGGRVARMQPPEWPASPAGPAFDALYEVAPMSAIEAARVNAQAIALMLKEVGINVNCLPLLDVARAETTEAITIRAYGHEPMRVAAMGRATLEGLRAGGVVGVIKHMPGHGRAIVDTHYKLPTVTASSEELEDDIAPFRALADAPMGMTSHIIFEAWDGDRPATLSPTVIEEVIRGRIGFDGLLMTDDIDMKALTGSAAEKAAKSIAAGCDVVLDCWARMDEMVAIAGALPEMTPQARARLDRAMATIADAGEGASYQELAAKRDSLLAYA
jgi:beta-N-acetylhexosaminidase